MSVLLGYGLGTLILGLAMYWGVVSYQRRNPANKAVTEDATRELYKNPERYEDRTKAELEKKLVP